MTYSTEVPGPSAWFKIVVQNTGGQPATGFAVSDSHGTLPYNQNNGNAVCDPNISSLAAGAIWQCRYRVDYTSASPSSNSNVAQATASNVVADGDDSHTATVHVNACTGGSNRTVPNLIGVNKAGANTGWTNAGFTGTLTTWSGQNGATVEAQNRPAFTCVPANSPMTVFKDPT